MLTLSWEEEEIQYLSTFFLSFDEVACSTDIKLVSQATFVLNIQAKKGPTQISERVVVI